MIYVTNFKNIMSIAICAASILTMPLSIGAGAFEEGGSAYPYQNPSTNKLGDLDGNGKITPEDDRIFKEYFAGKDIVIPNPSAADIDKDNSITRKDAMIFARYLAGWAGYSWVDEREDTSELPWKVPGAKQPKDYIWAEYEALTDAQKEAFFESFADVNDFKAWMDKAQYELPWENGGKQPKDYTWSEYEVLTDYQKEAFFESFADVDDFKVWMDKAQNELPWENDGKQPKDYTWAEYQALTDYQKEAFFESFNDVNDFKAWMDRAQNNTSNKFPWDELNAKQPEDYSWAEYEALTDAQKEAFFESFEDINDFKAWLEINQP